MTLRILEAGWQTLVVDFGRPSYRSLGVSIGGAADRTSLAIGNALVGNPPDAAALEVCLAGPRLQTDCPLACVLFGAPFEIWTDRRQLQPGKTFTLLPDEELRIGGTAHGMRAYFCVRGGFDVPQILGSRSSLEPLRAGAILPCTAGRSQQRYIGPLWAEDIGRLTSRDGHASVVRVVGGPQADWFSPNDLFRDFIVSPTSNRMGLRLLSEPLDVPPRELVSEPVCPGSIQVTREGQCIVLGVDGQTIGGYPKIAQVISADLDLLGQLRPGDTIRFSRIGLQEAEAIYRQKRKVVQEWVARLRCGI